MSINLMKPFRARRASKIERKPVNPWRWQDPLGYSQAIAVRSNQGRTLYCAGQAAIEATGQPAAGTMPEQMALCLRNLDEVILKAGFSPSEIVRLNFYTTAIDEFFAAYGTITAWMKQHRIAPSSTLLQVSALAFPGLKIEIEATLAG